MPEIIQVFASEAGGAGLPETRWTTVFQVGSESSAESQAALSLLCHAYWYPLHAFARRKGQSPEDAEDLVQEFFARQSLRANQNCFVAVENGFRATLVYHLTEHTEAFYEKTVEIGRDGVVKKISSVDDVELYRARLGAISGRRGSAEVPIGTIGVGVL